MKSVKMVKSYHMPRTCLSALLVLQLISTFERQIFDFLGYMWMPILGNFFNLVFVIFGLFGLYQYRIKYLLTYSIWTLAWIAYNVFIICFYLNVGDLDSKEDILSFGAGSFSWWLINSPGCRPQYNSTDPDPSSNVPPRPSQVEGCFVRFEKIEITHAAIQIVLATLGLLLTLLIMHYFITVLQPKMEKQSVKAMYSIEYSPQDRDSNPNTLERETNLAGENGDLRVAMTPRRVKRRSYRNSTRNSKSMNRQNNRQSGRSARSSARSHKSINPVTRLIDADQNRADSSTSNDAERYGQVNPGFQNDTSRPNSIYNLSGPPTDIEPSRPHSALTSYSNFHGQRRPNQPNNQSAAAQANPRNNVTNLTQESLMNHEQNLNASYDDDLPPPPPPLSSSPAPPPEDDDGSEGGSSVATAQLPVPQTRGSARRNEYVNIPIQKSVSPVPDIYQHQQHHQQYQQHQLQGYQDPEPQSPVSPTPPTSGGPPSGAPPVPPHNYANLPDSRMESLYGARPRPTNPLYSKTEYSKTEMDISANASRYSEMDRSTGVVLSYEAETLRADTKLIQPGLYNDPYSLSDVPSQRSSTSEPYPSSPRHLYSHLPEPGHGQQRPLPQSPRHKAPASDPNMHPLRDLNGPMRDLSGPMRDASGPRSLQLDPAPRGRGPQPPERFTGPSNLRYNPETGRHSLEPLNGSTEVNGAMAEGLKRVPNGHAARDRNSLRLKQKREMESRASLRKLKSGGNTNYHSNGPTSLQNGHAAMSNGHTDPEDKWYMKDSMRPVGASVHGDNCKCYRCQRKLTAI